MVKIEEIEDRPWEKLSLQTFERRGNIPAIIHQLVSNKNLTRTQEQGCLQWHRLHPDWYHIMWTESDVVDYIDTFHPEFTETFRELSMGVQRLEVFRYFVLHDYGGVCTDINFVPKSSLEEYVVQGGDLIIAFNAKTRSFSNSLMASTKNHDFWKLIWKEILNPNVPEWVARGKFLSSSFKSGQTILNKILTGYTRVFSIFPLSTLDLGPRLQTMRTQFTTHKQQINVNMLEPYKDIIFISFLSIILVMAFLYGRGVSKKLQRV